MKDFWRPKISQILFTPILIKLSAPAADEAQAQQVWGSGAALLLTKSMAPNTYVTFSVSHTAALGPFST